LCAEDVLTPLIAELEELLIEKDLQTERYRLALQEAAEALKAMRDALLEIQAMLSQ